jgi:hypothetical protein
MRGGLSVQFGDFLSVKENPIKGRGKEGKGIVLVYFSEMQQKTV